MEKEIWKSITGYEGMYEVSNLGRIKSLERTYINKNGVVRRIDGRIMKKNYNKNGYVYIMLCKNKDRKMIRVHRLVAREFCRNPENKDQVNHIDGVKANNRASNLEWVTQKENSRHAYDTGLNKGHSPNMNGNHEGSKHHNSKLDEEKVSFIRANYRGNGGKLKGVELAEMFNVTKSAINSVTSNQTWTHVK